ncbi:hypothetical protein Xen7305DRAFT_00006580 [Xenococcus sp. PCC 7305]|nr:hypothetical protein Xen7305DRAFT_00006580 [Xenococcus sp. PCC 7305]
MLRQALKKAVLTQEEVANCLSIIKKIGFLGTAYEATVRA